MSVVLAPKEKEKSVAQEAFPVSPGLTLERTHYCPGCQHGIAHRIIAEVLSETGLAQDAIGVSSIGCSAFIYNYIDIDWVEAPHGRAGAVATGVKRANPNKIVFAYQGDGDFGAIGLGESIHAANRGENISVFLINNTVYGMTGGQTGPTTLVGQKTTTSPAGRNRLTEGSPLKFAEMFACIDGVTFSARCALDVTKHVLAAKRAIRKAIENQAQGLGYSLIEMLSGCSVNWKMDPRDAAKHISEAMIPVFPLGVYKDTTSVKVGG